MRRDSAVHETELHGQGMAPCLRAVGGREYFARDIRETEVSELCPVSVGSHTITIRDRQTGLAERRKICGFRAEAVSSGRRRAP